jgi:hypothetical protein
VKFVRYSRRLAIAATALLAIASLPGCAGEAAVGPSPFAGNYTGTWVNVGDPADAGTSAWSFDGAGQLSGQDFDAGRETTFTVRGTIQPDGSFVSTSTPDNGDPAASLNGTLHRQQNGSLSGLLVWGVDPPLTYTYTLTPNP